MRTTELLRNVEESLVRFLPSTVQNIIFKQAVQGAVGNGRAGVDGVEAVLVFSVLVLVVLASVVAAVWITI